MQIDELSWHARSGWSGCMDRIVADLVLYFGARQTIADGVRHRELVAMYPRAHLLGCSTSGQIVDGEVSDDVLVAAAMRFDATPIVLAHGTVAAPKDSRSCGTALGTTLAAADLAGVFVLADGLIVDGDALISGLRDTIGETVPMSGGLAGDGTAFAQTVVGADAPPTRGVVGAVGFYGSAVRIGHGHAGGWDVFGPVRRITRADRNVIYEFDDEPALDLYERYLGTEEAKGLPATALRFPLRLHDPNRPYSPIIRSIFGVDRQARSLILSVRVHEGWMSQMMRGSFGRLASGAGRAVRHAVAVAGAGERASIAIMASCVARRMLMGQRIGDEIEEAESELAPHVARLGFYSYGEIAPHEMSGCCELHNASMSVTTLSEIEERS
jgi:hypothetical protein